MQRRHLDAWRGANAFIYTETNEEATAGCYSALPSPDTEAGRQILIYTVAFFNLKKKEESKGLLDLANKKH